MSWTRSWDARGWGDRKFRQLSPIPCSGQSLFIYLAIGPYHHGMPGLYEIRKTDLADRTGWTVTAIDSAVSELESLAMAFFDWDAGIVYCPNAIKNNPPSSHTNAKGWEKEFDRLPESDLKAYWYAMLCDFCRNKKGFDVGWNIDVPEVMSLDAPPHAPSDAPPHALGVQLPSPPPIPIQIQTQPPSANSCVASAAASPSPSTAEKDTAHSATWDQWINDLKAVEGASSDIIDKYVAEFVACVDRYHESTNGTFTLNRRAKVAKRLGFYNPSHQMFAMEIHCDSKGSGADERYCVGIAKRLKRLSETEYKQEMTRHRKTYRANGLFVEANA